MPNRSGAGMSSTPASFAKSLKPARPNPGRAAALKDAIQANTDKSGASLSVKPVQNFGRNDPIIKQGDVPLAKKAKAIGAALDKVKPKYVYTSGNLRNRLGPRKPNPIVEA